MRIAFYTLGCKVNLNETGALEQMFRSAGFTIVPEGEEADGFVVNSCTVTNFGDQKSRKWLRRKKRENPGAVTVLTGCYPQAFPEEAAQFMEADLVCGNGDRKAILENVQKLLDGHERIVAIAPHAKGEQFEELPVERFETHTRAFIKVEDGCNRQCAYCVIPRARGPVRSRAEDSILKELRQLAASGYREVVLSAISLPSYGLDTGTYLVELVEKCAQVPGIERIRLGSLDPDMLTPEYIEAVRTAYAGGRDYASPDLSPLFADLTGFPPTLIQAGDHEILYSDAEMLCHAQERAGVPCRFEVSEGMWHVFQMFPLRKAAAAMESVARFLLER